MTVHEIMSQMQDGLITTEEAATLFRQFLDSRRPKPQPQFDQQERRLLIGFPIVETEELDEHRTNGP